MDFVIIANAWTAAVHNPTSKHQIALELAKQGHRVLWVESAGMRVPKIGSSQDRSRIWGKIVAACRGAVRSEVSGLPSSRVRFAEASRFQVSGLDSGAIWVLSPLTVPLPASAAVRALNAGIYLHAIRKNAKKLGFGNAVLVNFMPTVPRVLKSWRGRKVYYLSLIHI